MSKKRKLIIILAAMLSLSLIGCSKIESFKKEVNEKDSKVMKVNSIDEKKQIIKKLNFKDLGFQFSINDTYEKYVENEMIFIERTNYPNEVAGYFITSDDVEKIKKEKSSKEKMLEYKKPLFLIKVVDKNNDILPSNVDELAKKYLKNEKIGEVNNFEYYLWHNDLFDTSNLSEKAKKEVKEILEGFDFLKKNIELIKSID